MLDLFLVERWLVKRTENLFFDRHWRRGYPQEVPVSRASKLMSNAYCGSPALAGRRRILLF